MKTEELETGTVCFLAENGSGLPQGLYVITGVGELVTVRKLALNEDGDLATTWRSARLAPAELCDFTPILQIGALR